MAIIRQELFEDYEYAFYNSDNCYDVQISNAGYISLRGMSGRPGRLENAYSQIQFGDSVTCIGPSCCANTTLSVATFGKNLLEIRNNAFCLTNLRNVYIPDSVSVIGKECFASCDNLSSVRLPPSCEYIPDACFSGCRISSIEIPDGTLSIGCDAFKNTHISDLTLPDSLKYLYAGAFSDCNRLSSVVVPDSADADENPFYGCAALSSHARFQLGQTGNAAKLKESKYGIVNGRNELLIPLDGMPASSVKPTAIGARCFENNIVQQLDFSEDQDMSELTAIGSGAFRGCMLTSIELPESTLSISEEVFKNSQLLNISLPSNLQYIDIGAFSENNSLTFIDIPESVERIGNKCFEKCPMLTHIVLSGEYTAQTIPQIGENVILDSQQAKFYILDKYRNLLENTPAWNVYLDKIIYIETPCPLNDATIDSIPNQAYTSYEICPEVTVRFNSEIIDPNKLYIIYSNNINIGTATVTVQPQPGITKYTGSKTAQFSIITSDISLGDIFFHTAQ